MKLIIINGPNLNMLGKRDAAQYGSFTLDELKTYTQQKISEKKQISIHPSIFPLSSPLLLPSARSSCETPEIYFLNS